MNNSKKFEMIDEESIYEDSENEDDEDEENNLLKKKFNENEELIDEYASEDISESNNTNDGDKNNNINNDVDNLDDLNDEIRIEMDDITEADVDKLNELLFCVQGIGKFIDEKKTIYEKKQFCEPSLRDIHRFLRKDDPENPKCRYSMLSWRVVENDIIPLILNYENNEKIQQLGLVILVDLTEPLPDIIEHRTNLESMLTDLQENLVNSNLIELIARNLADATAKLREAISMRNELREIENIVESEFNETKEGEKVRADEIKKKIAEVENKSQTTIELIFVLFKQIFNIVNSIHIGKTVNNTIILFNKFSKLKIFDAIVFHSQNFKSDYYKRLSVVILELVYFLIRPFTINHLFYIFSQVSKENISTVNRPKTSIQALIEEEKEQKRNMQALLSSRPNNFGTMIKVTRPVDKSSFIVSNVNELFVNPQKMLSEKINEFSNQRKKPRRNMRPKSKNISASKATEEIKLINDFKIAENFTNNFDCNYKEAIISFKNFCDDYLKHCFNELIKHFFLEIKLKDKLEKYDIYYIIRVMTFFLEFNRFREHLTINQGKASGTIKSNKYVFNVNMISESIIPEMMDFVFDLACEESIKKYKKEINLYELYSSISYLKQAILVSFDLYKFTSDENVQHNVLIQDHIITKDFSHIIKSIFALYNENYYPKKILYECIELTEVVQYIKLTFSIIPVWNYIHPKEA